MEDRELRPTYFDQITASREALAEFLTSIPALDTPWDKVFQRTYCADCSAENCDAENCPHQAERISPAWFLAKEVADGGNDPCYHVINQTGRLSALLWEKYTENFHLASRQREGFPV